MQMVPNCEENLRAEGAQQEKHRQCIDTCYVHYMYYYIYYIMCIYVHAHVIFILPVTLYTGCIRSN